MYFESLMLLHDIAVNLNYKVYKAPHSATYLHISKLLYYENFQTERKVERIFIMNTHTQHLDSTVSILLYCLSICSLLLLNPVYRH